MKLSDAQIRKAKPAAKPYKMADGRGLTLIVEPHGSKLWRFRYRFNGSESMLSLGCYPDVSLNDARDLLVQARRALADGQRPVGKQRSLEQTMGKLFGDLIEQKVAAEAVQQRASTQQRNREWANYLIAELGQRPIKQIDGTMMAQAITRIAEANGYTAAARGLRLAKRVFAHATVNGDITNNWVAAMPMPVQDAVKRQGRQGVTNAADLTKLLQGIKTLPNVIVRAGLQLLSLCFTRPVELRKAQWQEFDLDAEQPLWTIPAERMKMDKEHLVPLSRQAVTLLKELQELTGSGKYVLPSFKKQPIAATSFNAALNALGWRDKHQPHGFRVTASTLLHEQGHNPEVIEAALAHTRPGVAGVYNRSHLLPQRRELLQSWADYIDSLAKC